MKMANPMRCCRDEQRKPRTTLAVAAAAGALIAAISSCQRGPNAGNQPGPSGYGEGRAVVYAVNYPLYYITSRLAGPAIEVRQAAASGEDPDAWRPSADEIRQMQQADLVVIDGGGISSAKWLDQVSLPVSRMCRTVEALDSSDFVLIDDYEVHSHGPEGEHAHSGIVPEVWLDPLLLKKQAAMVAQSLADRYPEQAETVAGNLKQLNSDLDELSALLSGIAAAQSPVRVYSSSPELKYLTRAAGLQDDHLHWSNRPAQPNDDSWKQLDELLQEQPAKWMLWARQPSAPVADQLAHRELEFVVLNPLRQAPVDGDYLSEMKENIRRLKTAVSGP